MQFMTYSVPADVELFVKGKSLVLLEILKDRTKERWLSGSSLSSGA